MTAAGAFTTLTRMTLAEALHDLATTGPELPRPDPLDYEVQEPFTNPLRGVGRNDPCPCGSGKKFRKCCLDAATA